jgi:hypothetical protein
MVKKLEPVVVPRREYRYIVIDCPFRKQELHDIVAASVVNEKDEKPGV